MKYSDLGTFKYFRDSGYRDDSIGMTGFFVNTNNLEEGQHIECNGMRLNMIYRYEGEADIIFASSDFSEFSLPVNSEFDVELVTTKRRVI